MKLKMIIAVLVGLLLLCCILMLAEVVNFCVYGNV